MSTKNILMVQSASLAVMGFWVSLFASYRLLPAPIPPTDMSGGVIATGGFPFKAFDYPAPPLGAGVPLSAVPLVFLNFFMWFLFACVVVGGVWFLSRERSASLQIIHDKLAALFIFCALFLTGIGVIYLFLRFD